MRNLTCAVGYTSVGLPNSGEEKLRIMTEYHMRSDNMSAENRLLIAALKMSQNVSCGAKRPGAYEPTQLFQVNH